MIADQAAKLREMVERRDRRSANVATPSTGRVSVPRSRPVARRSRLIAITSGKGGVGKTTLAANLGLFWAQMGKRVVLLDLDLGLANVDVMLNLRPRYNLSHVITGKLRMTEVLTFCGGMGIVPGSSGVPDVADLGRNGVARLIDDFDQLQADADIILLDTAAGIGSSVIDFLSAADEVLIVVTTEPTSVMDAYAMIKMLSRRPNCPPINLVVNMARDKQEGLRVSRGIVEVSKRFLDREVRAVGYVPVDAQVAQSVRQRRPFILSYPNGLGTKAVRGIGRAMIGNASAKPRSAEGFLGRMLSFLSTGRSTETTTL